MTDTLQSAAIISQDADVLARIASHECSLAIWERGQTTDWSALISSSEGGAKPADLRFASDLEHLPGELHDAMATAGFGKGALRSAFVEDVAMLAKLYCAAMDLSRFELRLECVSSDSCRKFHADYVSARLITTYVGSGTCWLDHDEALRLAQGHDPRRVNQLDTGDVGLFKGKLGYGEPAIHRSPVIEGTGEVRLLLVLNPPAL